MLEGKIRKAPGKITVCPIIKWGIFALVESLELSHIPKFLTQFFSCPKIHAMQGPSVTNNHFQNVTVFGVAAQSKVNVESTKVTATVTMNVMVL